jgi:hypothetical protein
MIGLTTNTSFGFLAESAGTASILALQVPPSATAIEGMPFAQQPVLQIRDQFGNPLTSANRNPDNATVVSAAIATGNGTLQGTLSTTVVNGLASFSDLAASEGDTTITIRFTSSGLAGATSGEVLVSKTASAKVNGTGTGQNVDGGTNTSAQAANLPPVIQNLISQRDGSMELRASGSPGRAYVVQACEKIGAWATLSTVAADNTGTIVFVDRDAVNHASRFYRISAP